MLYLVGNNIFRLVPPSKIKLITLVTKFMSLVYTKDKRATRKTLDIYSVPI